MHTPILQTERLLMRPLTMDDAQHIFNAWASDDEVSLFMRWNTHKSIEETKEWLLLEQANIDSDNYNWGFVLNESGKLIGSGGLLLNHKKNCYELGYNLMKAQWGKGFATEASKKIIDFAKYTLNLNKLYCGHANENFRSENVIKKLGFDYHGEDFYTKFDGTKIKSKSYYMHF